MRIILASRSPARRELMKKLGVKFECYPSGYRENMRSRKVAWKLAEFLALGKAKFVARKFADSLIIGADTFITCKGKKIGKPKSMAHAKRLIRFMSGRTIKVYTGVALVETDWKCRIVRQRSACAVTNLVIKNMSREEVDVLAGQERALEISGAFSIEGEGGKMITRIRGDYDNVIGLPIFLVRRMLERYGSLLYKFGKNHESASVLSAHNAV